MARITTLIGDKNFSLKDIESVKHIGAKRSYYSENLREYTVEFSEFIEASKRGLGLPREQKIGETDFLAYHFATYKDDEETRIDFSLEELSVIPFKAEGFIYVSFGYYQTLKRVLRQPDFPQNIYVDDENGSILSLQEFNKLE